MPDDTTAAIAVGAGGLDGRRHCGLDRPELVVLGHPLDQPGRLVGEEDKVAHQVEEPCRLEDPSHQHFELGPIGDDHPAVNRLPRGEVLEAGAERTHDCLQPIGGHAHDIGREHRGDVGAVGLELVPRAPEGGVLVARVLQLEQAEGQAVHEHDDVGPAALGARLDDRELVGDEPVVALGALVVEEPGERVAHLARRIPLLHGHALGEEAVDAEVLGQRVLRLGPEHRGHHAVDGIGPKLRVYPLDGGTEATAQDDLVPTRPLRPAPSGPISGPPTVEYPSARNHSRHASSTTDSVIRLTSPTQPVPRPQGRAAGRRGAREGGCREARPTLGTPGLSTHRGKLMQGFMAP